MRTALVDNLESTGAVRYAYWSVIVSFPTVRLREESQERSELMYNGQEGQS
jgi:hypothetical protein